MASPGVFELEPVVEPSALPSGVKVKIKKIKLFLFYFEFDGLGGNLNFSISGGRSHRLMKFLSELCSPKKAMHAYQNLKRHFYFLPQITYRWLLWNYVVTIFTLVQMKVR